MKNDQYRRYKDAAREYGVDESAEALKRVLGRLVPPKRKPEEVAKKRPKPKKRDDS